MTLVLQKARAAIACRWKVNAYEAPLFANEVANQYLELRADGLRPNKPGARLRARALNQARRKFLKGNTRSVPACPGLNTAAAFELYGLG